MKHRNRLLPGTHVHHRNHGPGVVLIEWGPIPVKQDSKSTFSSANDVYDVIFGVGAERYLHCCRIEHLVRI